MTPAAGYYASQQDLELAFGTSNVCKWSNRDNPDAPRADADRLQAVLDAADEDVNAYFRGSAYALPLPVGPTVTRWAVLLAGQRLYREGRFAQIDKDVLKGLRDDVADARREMEEVKVGHRRLHAPRRTGAAAIGDQLTADDLRPDDDSPNRRATSPPFYLFGPGY